MRIRNRSITFIIIGLSILFADCTNSSNKSISNVIIPAPPPVKKSNYLYLTQDSCVTYVRNANTIKINKKGSNPFNKLDYNKVIAYDYDADKEDGLEIITNSKYAPTIIQQRELNQDQVNTLTNFLGSNSTYGGGEAACFDPHLGIIFYKDTTVVAYFSICLECNYLISSIKVPAIEKYLTKIEDGSYAYLGRGFSKSGRLNINSLCIQLNFNHCVEKLNTHYDK